LAPSPEGQEMTETKEKTRGEAFAAQVIPAEQRTESKPSHSASERTHRAAHVTSVPAQHAGVAPLKKVKRRSGRVKMEVPILLMGSDGEGRVFSEETRTVIISQHGAGVVSRQKLVAEQEVVMRTRPSGREAVVRVVGEIGMQGTQHTYGVAFMDERVDFWMMDFPPAPENVSHAEPLVLKCSGCTQMVELTDGDFEYDICAIHGGLARFCEECGMLTVWKVSHDLIPKAAPVRKKEAPKEEEAAKEKTTKEFEETIAKILASTGERAGERRSRVRAKVNFFANVCTEEFGEDVVTCIDMSKGGVSFRSKKKYEQEMRVLIAVPFSAEVKEAPAIFVRGRIANVRESGKEGIWRCGLEFLRG
jgi:hypothetical protein